MAARSPALKVAVVVQAFPKLSETFIQRQIAFLDASVICERFDEPLYRQLGLKRTCHVIGERSFASRWLKKAAFKLGFYFDHWDGRQRREVAKLLARERFDVVLAEFGPNGIKAAPVCAASDVPVVVHFHGYDLSWLLRHRFYVGLLRKALQSASGAVVVNERMRERLQRLGVDEPKVHLIPYGVDVEQHRPEANAGNGVCTFLAVGRLVDKKAPLLTVKAFERCARQAEDVRLRIIGDGPLFEDVKTYVSASDQRARIELLGARPHSEVEAALKNANVFVQHSVKAPTGDEEGWPNSVAEAAATGLPIVATRHGGIPTQVVDGQTGYLVEEGDYEAMGDKMICLARDASLRRRLGRSGRRHIQENGDLRQSLNRLRQVLTDCAEKGRG